MRISDLTGRGSSYPPLSNMESISELTENKESRANYEFLAISLSMKLFVVEGNQLKLVYEYMDNNCLSRALFELISSIHHKHFFYSSKIFIVLNSMNPGEPR
ncbi:hypothetical protein NC651_039347 [Populus alba x Populus x berolinensis]|nr:hypothetical protein NC651_039347 [Populus alba x Populus x berolinensis]